MEVRPFIDDLGRLCTVPVHPQRIVSLCPSITETLVELDAPVVGRTRFCVHPAAAVRSILRVGGTKDVAYDRITTLAPDLIICEKEENTPEIVARLSATWPVVVLDVRSVAGAIRMVEVLGQLTARPQATAIAARIQAAWASIVPFRPGQQTAYLIWRSPWMGAGQDTYIGDVLRYIGYDNVLAALPGRYPVITPEQLRALAPAQVLLSSEPFPFEAAHVREVQAWLPAADIRLVDGEMFSWYGTRMLEAAPYLADLITRV